VTPVARRALADAADALARIAREAASEGELAPTRMFNVASAAAFAAVSRRTVQQAIRQGALAAYGTQRDRAVKGADLLAWIESRRHQRPVTLNDEAERDIDRRGRQLERERVAARDSSPELEPLRRRLVAALGEQPRRRKRGR
jgi:hypothetical protein